MSTSKQVINWERILILVTMVAIGLAGGVFIWRFMRLPPEIPWLYSLPWGEQQLMKKEWFGVSLGGLLLVTVINFFWARKFRKEDGLIGLTILAAGLLVVILYLASFWQVMRILW